MEIHKKKMKMSCRTSCEEKKKNFIFIFSCFITKVYFLQIFIYKIHVVSARRIWKPFWYQLIKPDHKIKPKKWKTLEKLSTEEFHYRTWLREESGVLLQSEQKIGVSFNDGYIFFYFYELVSIITNWNTNKTLTWCNNRFFFFLIVKIDIFIPCQSFY